VFASYRDGAGICERGRVVKKLVRNERKEGESERGWMLSPTVACVHLCASQWHCIETQWCQETCCDIAEIHGERRMIGEHEKEFFQMSERNIPWQTGLYAIMSDDLESYPIRSALRCAGSSDSGRGREF